MNEIIPYYKPLGITPLEAISKLRAERPELDAFPITYAGRLDPMAEGLLLLLVGDAVHQKDDYTKLDKTYEAKILLGFCSDTFDVLGLAELAKPSSTVAPVKKPQTTKLPFSTAVSLLVGTHEFPYPDYSSKTVQGKPMWMHAREGNLKDLQVPTRAMTVLSAELSGIENAPWAKIFNDIKSSISLVDGEFRQTEILKQWGKLNSEVSEDEQFQIITVTFKVSSGTYIRTLANELGRILNTKALLLHLKRTEIGSYKSAL